MPVPGKEARTWLCNSFTAFNVRRNIPPTRKLFDTLYNFTKAAPEPCLVCGGARDLRVTLDFQLGAGDSDYKIISALLPEKLESWLGEEQEEVTFYPFLVVLETVEGKQFCWMPYWHVTGQEATASTPFVSTSSSLSA